MYRKYIQAMGVILATTIFTSSAQAQDNPTLLMDLASRVGSVEAENRELRGQLEESRHEISQLTQRMETLSSDVDYRLSHSEGGAPAPQALGMPSEESSLPEETPAASTSTEAYEKARSLLEQGDYAAAEHAFSAFVSTYPKDEHAGAAQYWLGVTFFVRGEHEKAATAFAKGYKNYSKSSKAADNLAKLAKSLAALDRMPDACTALDQLESEHPKSPQWKEAKPLRKQYECK
jgi:tol-pal system protein YbgF